MPMISSRSRKALTALALLGGVMLAQQASAACNMNDKNFKPQNLQISMGRIVVLPNTPVGGVIKELRIPINERRNVYTCAGSSGSLNYKFESARPPVGGMPDVRRTNVDGIGIRILQNDFRTGRMITYPYIDSSAAPANSFTENSWGISSSQFVVQIIKVSERTGSGPIAPADAFTAVYVDGGGSPILTSSLAAADSIVFSPTCDVQAGSKNIVVDFGSIPNTTFNGVGSRSIGRDFSIGLRCQGDGAAEYQSQIGIRLDANQDSSNMPGVLKLSETSGATGVGIEMVWVAGGIERVVRFGEVISVDKTALARREITLALRARYVQTQVGRVGAGLANGQATFTVEYQ